ncbi:MAG: NADH-quinone oxidoreductase subunit NuoF [Myxococcota bacterium]
MSTTTHGTRPPQGPATREFTPAVKRELEALCSRYPKREAALLPALRLLEREFGCVDDPGMRHVADLIGVSPAKVFGVFTFYTHYRRATDGKYVMQVCSTLSCALNGSEAVFDELAKELGIGKDGTTPDGMFTLKKVECLANCDQAPCLQVNEDFVDKVKPDQVRKLLDDIRSAKGEYHPPPQQYHLPTNPHPPVLLQHVLEPGSHTLAHYEARGGYEVARDLFTTKRNPDEIVELVFQSGLRGRGGAGFPTGQKWKFLAKNDKPRYLVINADESEPGTFKDKLLIDKDPHVLLEGIAIAAYAIKAKAAYIYIRGEFGPGAKILQAAIDEGYAKGMFGKSAFGSGLELDVTVHRGAGAYICGEETALLSSLEGGRGHPRIKPPFPAVEGAWACPTIVNNVETLACLPGILKNGPAWFKSRGTEKSAGTKLFSISGHVVRPGNYELPLGTPLRELIFDIAGGIPNGKKLKAVCPGGSSSPFLTADEVLRDDPLIRLDFESLAAAGSMLGSGAIIVMDEDTCMVDAMWNILRFYAHESCGQCTPCREGTGWIAKTAGRFERGGGRVTEIDQFEEVTWGMVGRTICVLADAAAMPARSILRKFRSEFEDHAQGKPCKHAHKPIPFIGKGAAHHA